MCGRSAASPIAVSLVPAYNQCTSPNRLHGPPDLPGGDEPGRVVRTTGSAVDAGDGRYARRQRRPAANSVGSLRMKTIVGNPGTPADEADVGITVNITDVRAKTAGAAGLFGAAPGTRAESHHGPPQRPVGERGRDASGHDVSVRRAVRTDRQYQHRVDMLALDDHRSGRDGRWGRRRRCAGGVGARPGGAPRRWGGWQRLLGAEHDLRRAGRLRALSRSAKRGLTNVDLSSGYIIRIDGVVEDLVRDPRDAQARAGVPGTRSRRSSTSRRASSGSASYGQIYPELARLEELGLVTGEADSSNGRRRKAYELTPAGERALHEWLTSDEPLHIELRHEGALKFFFSDALTRRGAAGPRAARPRHACTAWRSSCARSSRLTHEGKPPAPLLTLEFGIAYQEFLADWCAQAEERLAIGRSKTAKEEVPMYKLIVRRIVRRTFAGAQQGRVRADREAVPAAVAVHVRRRARARRGARGQEEVREWFQEMQRRFPGHPDRAAGGRRQRLAVEHGDRHAPGDHARPARAAASTATRACSCCA